jgi:hypothetical protein
MSQVNNNDINNLISMLTSESNTNSVDTPNLESKLKNILTQNGGGDDEIATELLENKLYDILKASKQTGGATAAAAVPFMLGVAAGVVGDRIYNNHKSKHGENSVSSLDIGNWFNSPKPSNQSVQSVKSPTPSVKSVTQSVKSVTQSVKSPTPSVKSSTPSVKSSTPSVKSSTPSVKSPTPFMKSPTQSVQSSKSVNSPTLSITSPVIQSISSPQQSNRQSPKSNNKLFDTVTTVTSENQSDNRLSQLKTTQTGGGVANPALKAFAKLSKMVSEKLSISNGPKAKKVAGQLQRDIKEKYPNIELDDLHKKCKDHLEKNMDKYQKLLK